MTRISGVHFQPGEREALKQKLADWLKSPGTTSTGFARAHGIRACTAQDMARELRGDAPAASGVEAVPPASPAEIRDAAFWRRKAVEHERRAADAEHALRELAGIAKRGMEPPAWSLPSQGVPGRVAGLIHLSDLHVGEVVRAEEIGGVNAYDPEIFQRRFRRMIAAAIEILPRWAADSSMQGVIVALNGDMISGDIHDELRRTNALTSHEQVALATDELASGIGKIADRFSHVLVTVTPGNHGRITERSHAKRTAALSYDTMIGNMLARHFAEDPRITVQVAAGADIVFPILGHVILQTHGDAMGTGGGQGFAGPNLPIVRGGNKVELAGFAVREHYDIILTGHFHTTSNPGRILANGSIVGFSEFGMRIRAKPEAPQQWLGLIHEKWGLRERVPVALEDPILPERPRIRVPAVMQ